MSKQLVVKFEVKVAESQESMQGPFGVFTKQVEAKSVSIAWAKVAKQLSVMQLAVFAITLVSVS